MEGGRLGVAYLSDDGRTGGYRETEVFPTASSIKIAIVAEMERRFAAGTLDPSCRIKIRTSHSVGGSGVLSHLGDTVELTLADLATLTIVVSDNTASNLCLEAIGGVAAVNRWLAEAGAANTSMHRPIAFHLKPGDPPHTATGSPADFVRILSRLPDAVWRRMEHCSSCYLGRFLDINPFASLLGSNLPGFRIANKPGAVDGVRNDVGRVRWHGGDVTMAAMTRDVPDSRWTAENRAEVAIGLSAAEVVRAMIGGELRR